MAQGAKGGERNEAPAETVDAQEQKHERRLHSTPNACLLLAASRGLAASSENLALMGDDDDG